MNANEKMKKDPEAAKISLTPCFSEVSNAAEDSLTPCFGGGIFAARRLSLTPCFSRVISAARRLSLTPCFSGVFDAAEDVAPLQRFVREEWKPLKRFPQSPAGPVTQLKQGVNERAGLSRLVTRLNRDVNRADSRYRLVTPRNRGVNWRANGCERIRLATAPRLSLTP